MNYKVGDEVYIVLKHVPMFGKITVKPVKIANISDDLVNVNFDDNANAIHEISDISSTPDEALQKFIISDISKIPLETIGADITTAFIGLSTEQLNNVAIIDNGISYFNLSKMVATNSDSATNIITLIEIGKLDATINDNGLLIVADAHKNDPLLNYLVLRNDVIALELEKGRTRYLPESLKNTFFF